MLEPLQYIEYMRGRGQFPTVKPPRGVIISYQQSLLDYVKSNHETQPGDGFVSRMLFLKDTNYEIAIMGGFGIGSPVASIVMEELIAFGVKEFISMGTAGTLQKNIKIGDLVLCDRAIRDEGTSHHYLPKGKYAYPSKALTDRLAESLKAQGRSFHLGTTWTVDAPYRETIAEARHYQQVGVAALM